MQTRQLLQFKLRVQTITTDPQEINGSFSTYYKTLYTSSIFSIPDDIKGQMDRKLDASEFADAITNMKGGKAAGPDSLPVDIYNIFKDK